jgi:hypothetical protein
MLHPLLEPVMETEEGSQVFVHSVLRLRYQAQRQKPVQSVMKGGIKIAVNGAALAEWKAALDAPPSVHFFRIVHPHQFTPYRKAMNAMMEAGDE